MKLLAPTLLLLSATTAAFGWFTPVETPEINSASATAAVALIGGGLMVLRARRKK